MLSQSLITRTRYWPEILPITSLFGQIGAGKAGSPAPAELRSIPGACQVSLQGLVVVPNANVEFEFRTDNAVKRMRFDGIESGYVPISLTAHKMFLFDVYNIGAANPIQNYSVAAKWMVSKPTVAEKLFRKWSLTDEETAIANELGIHALVEKGIRPISWAYMKDREYHVLEEWVENTQLDLVADEDYTVLDIKAGNPDEFFVIDQAYCSDVELGSNISLSMKRDDDFDYVNTRVAALAPLGPLGGMVDCWIPALREIIITAKSPNGAQGVRFAFRVKKLRLTNILRARWGLASPNELPRDIGIKVKGGIL